MTTHDGRAGARPRHRRPPLVLAVLLPLVALPACGGGGDGGEVVVGAGSAQATAAETAAVTAAEAAAPTATATAPPAPPTTVPDRDVLVVGDSLVWLAADALTEAFAAEGLVARFAGGSGTGLLTAQTAWLDEIEAAVARDDPVAVVIEACCNYGATEEHPEFGYTLPDGSVVAVDSELMYELWADAAERAARAAAGGGATVLWVVAPPVPPDHPLHGRISRFNLIARNLVEEIPSLRLVDWEVALTGATGALLDPIQDGDGAWIPMRTDGLHLSAPANAVVVARTVDAVVAALEA
jgi:hypothetical protein